MPRQVNRGVSPVVKHVWVEMPPNAEKGAGPDVPDCLARWDSTHITGTQDAC